METQEHPDSGLSASNERFLQNLLSWFYELGAFGERKPPAAPAGFMAESYRAVPQSFDLPRPAGLSISAREWRLHGALFLLTMLTTTLAGMMLVVSELPSYEPPLAGLLDYLLYVPRGY